MPTTPNFGWTLPTVGGDSGAWGGILNTAFTDVDADVQPIKVTADAALARAGGTMTGKVIQKNEEYARVDLGNISGAVTVDLSTGNFFHATVTGNVTGVTITNAVSGNVAFFVLELTNGGAFTVTWGSAFKWPGGAAPSLTVSGVDLLAFYTRDGGTTVRAVRSMADSK